jgi:hypothetical protein
MRITILFLLSATLFLVAAKSHGRQLRLEREAAGYSSVSFTAANPPYVEELWRAERVRFWTATLIFAALVLAGLWGRERVAFLAVAVAGWAPALSFVVNGLLSARRTHALALNLNWYLITLACAAAVAAASLIGRSSWATQS